MTLGKIQFKRPTLLLDRLKCLHNIRMMAEKAARHNVIFRPHFKTHQSADIADWFRDFGTDRITVSSVRMAEYFAKNGWNDITIAFPVNLAELKEINVLASTITLNLLVESMDVVEKMAHTLQHPVGIFIKIDAGYHRTGIDVSQHFQIFDLISFIDSKQNFQFKGLIAHNGHTYHQNSSRAILDTHNQSLTMLRKLKTFLTKNGINPILSIGDTPAMSLTENLDGVDEIRPGNFVFYDLMQHKMGVCTFNQIAVVMACPVVALHPERLEVVFYGGAVHLSKEYVNSKNNQMLFGEVVLLNENGWSEPIPDTYVCSLSQEHGIIRTEPEYFHYFLPGTFIGVVPVHSCLVASMMPYIVTLEGKQLMTMSCDFKP